eukprot:364685-Chlamydomonas_euryale.AAC.17
MQGQAPQAIFACCLYPFAMQREHEVDKRPSSSKLLLPISYMLIFLDAFMISNAYRHYAFVCCCIDLERMSLKALCRYGVMHQVSQLVACRLMAYQIKNCIEDASISALQQSATSQPQFVFRGLCSHA